MTPDLIQLLREHWSDVPDADEATPRQAYVYAIRSRSIRGRLAPSLPPTRRRLASLVVAGVTLLAAAGLGLNTVLHSSRPAGAIGPTGQRGRTGGTGLQGPGPSVIHVSFNWSGRTLESLQVTVDPAYANDNVELEIVHRASADSTRYAVVYRSQFSATDPPSAWVGPDRYFGPTGGPAGPTGPVYPGPLLPLAPLSTWTGTIYPSDFVGGCQSGPYSFSVEYFSRGSHPVDQTETNRYGGGRFSCIGSAHPNGSGAGGRSGPTGSEH